MSESNESDNPLPSVDKSPPQMWTSAIAIAIIIILILVGLSAVAGVKLADKLASQLPALGGVLTFVALLVERVTEVFVSIWRDPAADLLEQQRDSYAEQQEVDRQAITDLNKELKDEKRTKLPSLAFSIHPSSILQTASIANRGRRTTTRTTTIKARR